MDLKEPSPWVEAGIEQQACLALYGFHEAAITDQAALAICGNWVLAPMVSGNNDPNHPVINIRAFGETTVSVIQLVKALIWGPQQYLVLATAHKFSKCREYGY